MDHSDHQHMDHSHHNHHHDHHQTTPPSDTGYHVLHDHGSHDQHEHDHHHQTFFNNAYNVTVLFQNWELNSKSSLFLACLVTVVLAVGYQGTKWLRQYLHTNYRDKIHSIKSKEHVLQTVLYGMEFLVSYVLMLVVMTYNAWIFAVTILGIGIGYFLFGWHRTYKDSPGYPECAANCNSLVGYRQEYDIQPSPQELVPLETGDGEQAVRCSGCNQGDKETDILT